MSARGVAAGLLLEVRILPMAAALLATALGAAWAGGHLLPAPSGLWWAMGSVFFGLYTAHILDTWVDVTRRNDLTPADYPLIFRDSSGLIPSRAYLPIAGACCALSALLGVEAAILGGPIVGVSLAIGIVIAVAYSLALDVTLLGVSFGYPTGVTAAMAAGYALAAGALDLKWALLALAIFMALAGTKVRSDLIDLADDSARRKQTVAVRFGERAAHVGGLAIALAGLALAAALPWIVVAPVLIAVPAAAAAVVVALSARLEPFRGSMLQAATLFALLAVELLILA